VTIFFIAVQLNFMGNCFLGYALERSLEQHTNDYDFLLIVDNPEM